MKRSNRCVSSANGPEVGRLVREVSGFDEMEVELVGAKGLEVFDSISEKTQTIERESF